MAGGVDDRLSTSGAGDDRLEGQDGEDILVGGVTLAALAMTASLYIPRIATVLLVFVATGATTLAGRLIARFGRALTCAGATDDSPTRLFPAPAALAGATSLPCMLYNVPGRTALNMTAETTLELAQLPNVVGIKEASASFEQIAHIVEHADVRVVQAGDGLGFALKARLDLRVTSDLRGQNLDRDLAIESNVAGAVDLAHATFSEFPGDFVISEGATNQRVHTPGGEEAQE